ncbi:MAG: hypothetical protein IPN23_07750 [Elusimicrobia bacterium]|nr:hypothetical protein [Elusimicrobiota bacterium]
MLLNSFYNVGPRARSAAGAPESSRTRVRLILTDCHRNIAGLLPSCFWSAWSPQMQAPHGELWYFWLIVIHRFGRWLSSPRCTLEARRFFEKA